ncbi:MAG: 3-deoxy-manno-octulosonate cytidylyltransferase [Nitrospirae bacterium]|nr:3-deoxy-manno-octulosonate cytidylyltransferase [Nitrospirota bacterium]
MNNNAIVIIPARYGSTRFPGKPLALLHSKPLIQWTYEAVKKSAIVTKVIVATDDINIYNAVTGFGGNVIMTSSKPRTGSDRCAEAVEKSDEDIIINLQADEILTGPEMVDELINTLVEDNGIMMGTLKIEIKDPEELNDKNVVKVVTDVNDFALYFSRSPIPFIRDKSDYKSDAKSDYNENPVPAKTFYKHLGIYAYRRDFLMQFCTLPTTILEDLEKLEQLRALEHGFKIKVKETHYNSYRIDTQEDLKQIETTPHPPLSP